MEKRKRRSQGLSINVLIVAAIALIVLVVLAAMFTGRVKIFSEGLQSCRSQQGECESGISCPDNTALVTNAKCPESDDDKNNNRNLCCVSIPGS